MKRLAITLSAGLLLVSLVPGSALAGTAVVDQSNTSTTIAWSSPDFVVAQTFKAGTSGALDSVDLYWGGTGTVSVALEGTTGTPPVPSGPELATSSVTLPVPDYEWVRFYFSTSYPVTAGQSYAIVFSTGSTAGVYGSADLYSRGRALITHTGVWAPLPSVFAGGVSDFSFVTYVGANLATPTPAPTPAPTAPPVPTIAPTPRPALATARPTAAPTSTPTPTPTGTSTASALPTIGATGSPSPIAALGATGAPHPVSGAGSGGSGSGGSGGSTILVVAIGIVVLLLLGSALGFLLMRRRRQRTAI